MKISNAIKKFLNYEKVKGSTDKTILNYKVRLNYFYEFLNKNIYVNKIKYEDYENFIIYLRKKEKPNKKKLSTYTIKQYARDVKTFLNYLYKQDLINIDFSKKLIVPKTSKKIIDILTFSDIEKIYAHYDKNSFFGCRNLLIITLMLDTGLRLSEVVNLCWSDFDFEKHLIKVFGKGQKERYVPLTSTISAYFILYKRFFDIQISNNIFINAKGQQLSANAVELFIKRLKKSLNIKKLYPHLFRHTFATMFLMNGGNIYDLKIILGHTSLEMVENYLHLCTQLNIYKQAQFSPLTKKTR